VGDSNNYNHNNNDNKISHYCVASACRLVLVVFCLSYSSTLKMEAIYSAKMLGGFRNTRCYNPEHLTLQSLLNDSYQRQKINKNVKVTMRSRKTCIIEKNHIP
jgi:hypothetical protein